LFSIGTIFGIFYIFDNRLAAILSEKGIWVKYYKFILWENITEFDDLGWYISINVGDPKLLSKQADLGGKVAIFWSKIFGYHHINISNITVSNEEIISFASKYIKHKGIIHE
jgi:hypothetical protein